MMNIKNIIREEIDNDFDWVRDIEPRYSIQDIINNYSSLQDISFKTEGTYHPTNNSGKELDFGSDFNHDDVRLMNLNESYSRGPLLTIKIDDYGRGHDGTTNETLSVVGCHDDCWNLTEHNTSITFIPLIS